MFNRPIRTGFRVQQTLGRGPIRAGNWSNTDNALIIIDGQSNAGGVAPRSGLSSTPLDANPDLATYDAGVFSRVYMWSTVGGAFYQLDPGFNQDSNDPSTQFGPEFGLAVRHSEETQAGKLYIIKTWQNGVAIASWRDGQSLFETAQSRCANALAWLSNNSVVIGRRGWLWVQGEADYTQTEAYYYEQLDALNSERVAAGMSHASERQVIAQMYSGSAYYGAGVDAANSAYVADNSAMRFEVRFTNHFNGDNVHLNAQGQVQLGYDAFEKIMQTTHLDA